MKSLKYKMIKYLFLLFSSFIFCQFRGIILDLTTKLPISYVTIYHQEKSNFIGNTTDKKGVFTINSDFEKLTFSHLDYKKLTLNKSQIKDTIYLESISTNLDEVKIIYKQPKWIKEKLFEVIKNKTKNYQINQKIVGYTYETSSFSDSSGYVFKSLGNLQIPKLNDQSKYLIDPQKNIIKYKNKSAGVDFSNLKRMLYDNFIEDFNFTFIKKNKFNVIYPFENEDKNLVKLTFKSIKFDDYYGYIILDTLRNVILEVEQNSGKEYNIKNQTSQILRIAAASIKGYSYEDWIVKNYTKYSKKTESFSLEESKYKFYMKSSMKNKKIQENNFISNEAHLRLTEINSIKNNFIPLPKPFYIIAIQTKKMRLEEEQLNKISKEFESF